MYQMYKGEYSQEGEDSPPPQGASCLTWQRPEVNWLDILWVNETLN